MLRVDRFTAHVALASTKNRYYSIAWLRPSFYLSLYCSQRKRRSRDSLETDKTSEDFEFSSAGDFAIEREKLRTAEDLPPKTEGLAPLHTQNHQTNRLNITFRENTFTYSIIAPEVLWSFLLHYSRRPPPLFPFFFFIHSYISWVHHCLVRVFHMWLLFNPAVDIITFFLRGWCMLGVFCCWHSLV